MKASTKAVLISALIFPGLGHLTLKRGARGMIFLLPALVAMLAALRIAFQITDQLSTAIANGTLPFDPAIIIARTQAAVAVDPVIGWAAAICVICWVAAIADVLWLSRSQSS